MNPRFLSPLVPLYAAGLALKNAAYDRGLLRSRRLQWPVVSIGNISIGGAGKTPLVIRLAALLKESGLHADVLTRGYGRTSTGVARVNVEGEAREFGDEPLLIARQTGVPVYVGASRYAAGVLAESEFAENGVHLLDDGFQHRQLARNVDIVVLHRRDFDDLLLPAGRLRETFAALRRASILVVRDEDRSLEPDLRRRGLEQPVWIVKRRLEVPPAPRALAFCGIAHPEEFFQALEAAGAAPVVKRAFRDHHAYSAQDAEVLIAELRRTRADGFLTTEKDAARLTAAQRNTLAKVAPLLTAKLTLELERQQACIAGLLGLLVRK